MLYQITTFEDVSLLQDDIMRVFAGRAKMYAHSTTNHF
jgi:hypothetical protein